MGETSHPTLTLEKIQNEPAKVETVLENAMQRQILTNIDDRMLESAGDNSPLDKAATARNAIQLCEKPYVNSSRGNVSEILLANEGSHMLNKPLSVIVTDSGFRWATDDEIQNPPQGAKIGYIGKISTSGKPDCMNCVLVFQNSTNAIFSIDSADIRNRLLQNALSGVEHDTLTQSLNPNQKALFLAGRANNKDEQIEILPGKKMKASDILGDLTIQKEAAKESGLITPAEAKAKIDAHIAGIKTKYNLAEPAAFTDTEPKDPSKETDYSSKNPDEQTKLTEQYKTEKKAWDAKKIAHEANEATRIKEANEKYQREHPQEYAAYNELRVLSEKFEKSTDVAVSAADLGAAAHYMRVPDAMNQLQTLTPQIQNLVEKLKQFPHPSQLTHEQKKLYDDAVNKLTDLQKRQEMVEQVFKEDKLRMQKVYTELQSGVVNPKSPIFQAARQIFQKDGDVSQAGAILDEAELERIKNKLTPEQRATFDTWLQSTGGKLAAGFGLMLVMFLMTSVKDVVQQAARGH